MRLTHVHIEAFRGIPRLEIALDAITVVIGENNHGKTSLFDVLGLCLARSELSAESRFREADFFQHADGAPRPIRIVLTFAEAPGSSVETPIGAAVPCDRDGSRRFRLELSGSPADHLIRPRFLDEASAPLDPQPDASVLHRLRRLHPVLLLRFARPQQEQPSDPVAGNDDPQRRGRGPLEVLITRVYHDLTHTRGPLPTEELARGLRAARRLFGRGDAEDSIDAPIHRMLNEILSDSASWGGSEPASSFRVRAGSGSHTVGLLLVLGAMLDVRGDEALPPDAEPIIVIEEPAAHLHPILLASTWDVIEALGAQTIVTTNSCELLSSVPMTSLRRLVRHQDVITARQLRDDTLSDADLRRLAYHIRAKRGGALFARCWLLVEGESEFWLLSHLAHVMGYDLEAEGVRCVEFAQCGVTPLIKLANALGIEWHLLADGDESGGAYSQDASRQLGGRKWARRVSRLGQPDVEQCLWHHGFDHIYWEAAGLAEHRGAGDDRFPLGRVIAKAVRKRSKPYLALMVADACSERGPDSIPPVLRNVIETSVALARESVAEGAIAPRDPA